MDSTETFCFGASVRALRGSVNDMFIMGRLRRDALVGEYFEYGEHAGTIAKVWVVEEGEYNCYHFVVEPF